MKEQIPQHHNQLNAMAEEDPARAETENMLRTVGANLYAHVITYGIYTMYECWKAPSLIQKVPDFTSEPAQWGLEK